MDYAQYKHLTFERKPHGVVLITIDRPDVLNATNDRLHWELTEVWRTLGQLSWRDGRRRAAVRWFGRALDEAERLRMRPEAARTRLEIARHLAETGAGATFRGQDVRTLVRDARRELEALDLAWDLARLDLFLSSVRGAALAADVR